MDQQIKDRINQLARAVDSGHCAPERHREFSTLRWKALEDAVGERNASIFMFMGHFFKDGNAVFQYKHIDSRRYLNIDLEGNFLRYTGEEYEPVTRAAAMERVFGEVA